ncbi:MAG TPA: hypothetical protein VF964_00350, partial [Vicinamibacteria bacterium]
MTAVLMSLLLLSACQGGGGGSEPTPPPDSKMMVGAHYYLWFPARFAQGMYLRGKLRPPQPPLLGEYSSASPAVAEQHIAWASKFGIDFFTLDWWPSDPDVNARIDQAFLAARNIGLIRFCIFYELGDLGFDGRAFTVFEEATVERFLADMQEIARRYFGHPRYLRARLRPDQKPQLGEYASSSPAVVEQHIAWAAASGVDFFTLDWWPSTPERNALIDQAVLAARNIGDIRFCIFYELWDLGYDPRTASTVFNGAAVERFLSD